MEAIVRRDDPTSHYEITVDGKPAGFSAYILKPGVVVFTHTEIDPAYEGQGVGGQLVQGSLDDVRARGQRVVPRCPFVRDWIDKHPDYADLVQGSHRGDGEP